MSSISRVVASTTITRRQAMPKPLPVRGGSGAPDDDDIETVVFCREKSEEAKEILNRYGKLLELTTEFSYKLNNFRDKNLVTLVGDTRAGKSLLLNYLAKKEIYEIDHYGKKKLAVRDPLVNVGQTFASETEYPGVYTVSNVDYCDTPGFRGTISKDIAAADSININVAMRSASLVKGFMIVVPRYTLFPEGSMAIDLSALCNMVDKLLPDLEKVSDSVVFVMNRFERGTNFDAIKESLLGLLRDIKGTEYQIQVEKVINFLQTHSEKIVFFDPLDDGQSRELLLEKIGQFSSVSLKDIRCALDPVSELTFKAGLTETKALIASICSRKRTLEEFIASLDVKIAELKQSKQTLIDKREDLNNELIHPDLYIYRNSISGLSQLQSSLTQQSKEYRDVIKAIETEILELNVELDKFPTRNPGPFEYKYERSFFKPFGYGETEHTVNDVYAPIKNVNKTGTGTWIDRNELYDQGYYHVKFQGPFCTSCHVVINVQYDFEKITISKDEIKNKIREKEMTKATYQQNLTNTDMQLSMTSKTLKFNQDKIPAESSKKEALAAQFNQQIQVFDNLIQTEENKKVKYNQNKQKISDLKGSDEIKRLKNNYDTFAPYFFDDDDDYGGGGGGGGRSRL
jgi:hypothetical protein